MFAREFATYAHNATLIYLFKSGDTTHCVLI